MNRLNRFLFIVFALLITSGIISAQEKLYWDFPEPVKEAYGGRFPELVEAGGSMAMIWQDFEGNADELNATISIRVMFSNDGETWSQPVLSVAEGVPYLWLEEVPLYSVSTAPDGRLIVAVAEGSSGVSIYIQESPGASGEFLKTATIPPGSGNADVPVAPRLAATPDGGFLLFLTRRTEAAGVAPGRNSLLTVFSASSPDGVQWGASTLFINLDNDRAIDGDILDQNFLPSYMADGEDEYVVFQSLRTGSNNLVYQLYLKHRKQGGVWESAIPITENLLPEGVGSNSLLWDNQRPSLGRGINGEILITWERHKGQQLPSIAAAVLNRDGSPLSQMAEIVSAEPGRSSFSSRIFNIKGNTWFLWFDSSGIRIARREAAADRSTIRYQVEISSLNALTEGSDQNSASFPGAAILNGNIYILWGDRSAGTPRSVLLKPDLHVDRPILRFTNFNSGKPGNSRSLNVRWDPPADSSGILSYSWLWSQNTEDLPSIEDLDQKYGETQSQIIFDNPKDVEGDWFFTLIVRDIAGNWSDPLKLSYTLDVTPPPPPVMRVPPTSADGFLNSNSFSLEWEDGEKEAAAYYRWRRVKLAGTVDELPLEIFTTQEALPVDGNGVVETSDRFIAQLNIDNGVWAYSVAAVDVAGNEGLPNTEILLTNRYVPVTFISLVTDRKDENDQIYLTIHGRGFLVGGLLSSAVIDEDGGEPWDYEFIRSTGQLKVYSDTLAEIGPIENMRSGTYRIGVIHPLRGEAFWNIPMRLDPTGNVKFGPFGIYKYESLWKPAARSLRLNGNQLLLLILILLGFTSVIITVSRLGSISREMKILERNARAILENNPISAAARKDAAMSLKKSKSVLKLKFTLAFSLLVLITILMVAIALGMLWISMERDTLSRGLESKSRLLIETLTTSAATIIPNADRGGLLLLQDRIKALPDARWMTVTGPRAENGSSGGLRATSDGYNYIWSTNDPDILDKLKIPVSLSKDNYNLVLEGSDNTDSELVKTSYQQGAGGSYVLISDISLEDRMALSAIFQRFNLLPLDVVIGQEIIDDEITPFINQMRNDVLTAVQDADYSLMLNSLSDLENKQNEELQRVIATLNFSDPVFLEAEKAVATQYKMIQTMLLDISNQFFSVYPDFNAEVLRSGESDIFVFYKPILYQDGQNPDVFKGVVRLAVSVDGIKASLGLVQKRILLITSIASIIALALGLIVALVFSSQLVRPIHELVRAVEKIQDEPNMLLHENFGVKLKTKDEISDLADAINGMVQGLFHAAVDQKELVAGQEIQKTFLPLDIVKNTQGDPIKLSTGSAGNAFFRLFGYYEGADAVSGDYFDFRQLDEDHYVMIKLDIAGHGVTASLIMVQVAALYVDYFRKIREEAVKTGRLSYNLREFTFGINDLINEVGFRGRFAAFNLSVMNVRTSDYEMIHAGDNLVHIYDGKTRKMKVLELADAPAAGQIESGMIEMNPTMYQVVKGKLNRGDILFLYTDGIEEAHHILRGRDFKVIQYKDCPRSMIGIDQELIQPTYEYIKPMERVGEVYKAESTEDLIIAALDEDNLRVKKDSSIYKQINAGQDNEEFDPRRIDDIVEAALSKGSYILQRRCDLTIGKPLHFDFSTLKGTCEDAVMALASVEKVFRIIPDETGGKTSRVKVDEKIVKFLEEHFAEFEEIYSHRVGDETGYVYYSHMKEDPQDDDLTIWAYERL